MKVLDHIWLWLILLFVGYVLIAGTPEARIVRLCEPVNWAGRAFESVTLLVVPEKGSAVRNSMNSTERGCHAVIYRQIYPEQYKAAAAAAQAQAAEAEAAAQKEAVAPKEGVVVKKPAEKAVVK